jgi:hypothetical protein
MARTSEHTTGTNPRASFCLAAALFWLGDLEEE